MTTMMRKIKVYKPKSLIEGCKLGRQYSDQIFVAIPQKMGDVGCLVAYKNKFMHTAGKTPVERLKFTDKYGRGNYFLYYYRWIPEKIWA